MEQPIISPHDTALVEADSAGRASLVLVDGSVRGYLSQQQREAARRANTLARWPRGPVMAPVLGAATGLMLAGLTLRALPYLAPWFVRLPEEVPIACIQLGFLLGAAAGTVLYVTGVYQRRTEALWASLDSTAGRRALVVRDGHGAELAFLDAQRGVFERVLAAITSEVRDRFQAQDTEAAEAAVRHLVEQAEGRAPC